MQLDCMLPVHQPLWFTFCHILASFNTLFLLLGEAVSNWSILTFPLFHIYLWCPSSVISCQAEEPCPNSLHLSWMHAFPNPWASLPKHLLIATLSFLIWRMGKQDGTQLFKMCVHQGFVEWLKRDSSSIPHHQNVSEESCLTEAPWLFWPRRIGWASGCY